MSNVVWGASITSIRTPVSVLHFCANASIPFQNAFGLLKSIQTASIINYTPIASWSTLGIHFPAEYYKNAKPTTHKTYKASACGITSFTICSPMTSYPMARESADDMVEVARKSPPPFTAHRHWALSAVYGVLYYWGIPLDGIPCVSYLSQVKGQPINNKGQSQRNPWRKDNRIETGHCDWAKEWWQLGQGSYYRVTSPLLGLLLEFCEWFLSYYMDI